MTKRKISLKKCATVLGIFIMIFVFAQKCDSESKALEKHGFDFAKSKFEPINWKKPDINVIGRDITRSMARDVNDLQYGRILPIEKYGLERTYCTATVMHAIKTAQDSMHVDDCDVSLFKNMHRDCMSNGNRGIKFFRDTYEADVPNAIVVIHNPNDMKLSKLEKQFKKMTPGTIVRYCGHYNNGKTHAHTEMYMGQGFCDDDGHFVPTRRGKSVMGAGYNNAIKTLKYDIEKYRANSGEPNEPILDSIVTVNVPRILVYQQKNR